MAQDRVEAVERALTVLEVFDSPRDAFALAELAEATGFYKSTLLRLLGSLARFDYVQRGEDGRWRLGGSPVRLARRHAPSRHLAARVQPWLDRLAAETGETAALLASHAGEAECRLTALPEASLRHDLRPGSRWPVKRDDDPRPLLPGGSMTCVALPTGPGEPPLWLSLSGPAGRLSTDNARRALEAARAALDEAPETEEP
ncbi:helix-turn-helix domain-containing protein [Halomonas organivorans]|uniref:DNA-binding IclR family transcriptional regulator n=1 Tax=Halomonas organivorans TaxID=257772 RepID=A0A7W5BWU9_9GAMM|nr:helix-turn-helix domain-containing protein [Halomonas organivorans]MBB3140587.1 DNA-binding IclR family transcriptional regulator [Halomonas organivorans]